MFCLEVLLLFCIICVILLMYVVSIVVYYIGNDLQTVDKPNLSNTEYQMCLVHASVKFVKVNQHADDKNLDIFLTYIGELYEMEWWYDKGELRRGWRIQARYGNEKRADKSKAAVDDRGQQEIS